MGLIADETKTHEGLGSLAVFKRYVDVPCLLFRVEPWLICQERHHHRGRSVSGVAFGCLVIRQRHLYHGDKLCLLRVSVFEIEIGEIARCKQDLLVVISFTHRVGAPPRNKAATGTKMAVLERHRIICSVYCRTDNVDKLAFRQAVVAKIVEVYPANLFAGFWIAKNNFVLFDQSVVFC